MGLIKNLINKFIKLSRPVFSFVDNQLQFKINSDFFFKYNIDNFDVKTRHDSYILEAYTLHNENIFLEYIKGDHNTNWNGEPLSLYEGFFKDKLRISSLEVIEKVEVDPYTFKVFKVDDNFILHLIYIYDVSTNVIIIDSKGDLYKSLIRCFKSDYKYRFEMEEKGSINYNISIVKENSLKGYIDASND